MQIISAVLFDVGECRVLQDAARSARIAFPDASTRGSDDERAVRKLNGLCDGALVTADRLQAAHRTLLTLRDQVKRESDEGHWQAMAPSAPSPGAVVFDPHRSMPAVLAEARRQQLVEVDAAVDVVEDALRAVGGDLPGR